PTAHKENGVFLSPAEQRTQVSNGLIVQMFILGTAVAHLQNRHTSASKVEQVTLHLLQYREGQRPRARVEIVHTPRHTSSAPTLLQHVLNVRHEWPRRQRFEGKITAFSNSTDEEIAPVPHQAELIETGHATAHLHGQGE